MSWVALAIAILANALANIAFKIATLRIPTGGTGQKLWVMLNEPWTWVGAMSAGVLLISYLVAIRTLGLAMTYAMVTSLSLVLITTLTPYIFGDRITVAKLTGIGLIILGIALMMRDEGVS